ncbi:hypothetical protein GCM10010954_18620 [Halobacillus andaensis]|uniref:Uncharacterized protein n=1 Tax=Halobacillus andaensis TaxID=1176239 RepID=A0A917B3X8_HALAA|nr:hypothetical protein [Halobacillus andaensis]MBP2004635.1 hypothetical protein [Halobacillus andaensis]GGF20135.1 hypothetical protein GCM10010954_18620 [Halobacillus andaensis]
MSHTPSKQEMDKILKKLEEDYIQSLDENEASTVEEFVEQFLYDSWQYNDRNIDLIKVVMSRYTQGGIYQSTFAGSFTGMVDHLQEKLSSLDTDNRYPALHNRFGASLLVSFVDGFIIQYYAGMYKVEDLRASTPKLKAAILQALSTSI